MRIPVKNVSRRSGTTLFVATLAFMFLIPVVGLAVDVGFLYTVRSKLQSSVDGASLAAARALSLGATTDAQATNAKQNAVNWFYANFPKGDWYTHSTLMNTSNTYVNVYDDATVPQLRHVDVFASTSVPTLFMRWFGNAATTVNSRGYATRRDVVAMLVLDRSGSMCPSSATPCSKTDTTSSCAAMINAAKLFTGQFAAGRDRIGMISFADNAYRHSSPTTTFQTVLGYTNTLGTATGEIDSVICHGGTNSAGAFSLAYNDLYQTNLPGALNVMVLETDGQPNTVTVNFWDGTSAGIASASNCVDINNRKKSSSPTAGFQTLASLPAWSPTPWNMNSFGTGFMSNPDATHNLIGGIGVNSTTYWLMYNNWTTSKSNSFNEVYNTANPYVSSSAGRAAGCGFNSSHNSASDIAWIPSSDIYGNSLTGYKATTLSSGHLTVTTTNLLNGSFNALDDAGSFARTNATLPVYNFTLGFSASVDHVILQRVANDPSWLGNASCTATGALCRYASAENQGTYVYAQTQQDLITAFLSLSSQILRLNR
ncbi:MAG: VWA domain-containing protein [Bryobacteraceae bacterium]